MRTRCLLALFLLAPLLASCSTDDDPTQPREVTFIVNGVEGTPFEVFELRARNAVHRPCLDGTPVFTAPYQFFLLSAFEEVQGVFAPTTGERLSDVLLFLGGETVPRRIDDPDETTPIYTGSKPLEVDTDAPPCTSELRSGRKELRFDVSGTPGITFDINIGDFDKSFILLATPVPATFFLEDARDRVTGVFTKTSDVGTLTVRLVVDGREVDTDTSEDGSNGDAVVDTTL